MLNWNFKEKGLRVMGLSSASCLAVIVAAGIHMSPAEKPVLMVRDNAMPEQSEVRVSYNDSGDTLVYSGDGLFAFRGALPERSEIKTSADMSLVVLRCRKKGAYVDVSVCNAEATASAPPCPTNSCYSGGGGGSYSGGGGDSDDNNAGYRDTDGDGVGDTFTDDCYGSCSEERGDEVDRFYDDDASDDGGDDGDNDGGGGGSSVLCTYFYQKGILDENLYYADIENAHSMIHPTILRGYHAWSISYVHYLRKHPNGLMEKIIRPVVVNRAQEVAYQLGLRDNANYIGKFIRMTFEPACYVIGLFAEKRDWRDLYNARDFRAFAKGYKRYKTFKAERLALSV